MLLYLFSGKFSQRVGAPELYFIAVRAVTTSIPSFGLFAGFGGLEHGYSEILQGNAPPQIFLPVLVLVSLLTGYRHDLQNPTRA